MGGRGWIGVQPTRGADGVLHFADAEEFQPNLTPEEVLRRGSFGGGYFRDISSGVTRTAYKDVWTELPPAWIDGLKVKRYVASPAYDASVNRYKVNCGVKDGKADSFGLNAWESRGWIHPQDPYGWFQWY